MAVWRKSGSKLAFLTALTGVGLKSEWRAKSGRDVLYAVKNFLQMFSGWSIMDRAFCRKGRNGR